MNNPELKDKLSSFNPADRADALRELMALDTGSPRECADVNMHFHSFFSFNAEGWSPTRIAWEAKKAGLYAAALCDFDVLDGMNEFLAAGKALGVRSAVHLETRAYLNEFEEVDINSPGEPGVTYIMGAGFAKDFRENSEAMAGQKAYREGAKRRNIELMNRINPRIGDIAIDYEKDVLPLTPSGTATERHIVRAYVNKAVEIFGEGEALIAFWAQLLDKPEEDVAPLLGTAKHEDAVRSKCAKKGGLGYESPSPETFPPVDDFVQWVVSCEAIPMMAWLDGTSDGEANAQELCDCLASKGVAALNIVPDRNWNYSDPEMKALKVGKLREIIAIANRLNWPINIGTEMNKAGLPFVDKLDGDVLSEFKSSFIRGAKIMVGHTLLLKYADTSYISDKVASDVVTKNSFFEAVGALPPLTSDIAKRLSDAGSDGAYGLIHDAVKAGMWK